MTTLVKLLYLNPSAISLISSIEVTFSSAKNSTTSSQNSRKSVQIAVGECTTHVVFISFGFAGKFVCGKIEKYHVEALEYGQHRANVDRRHFLQHPSDLPVSHRHVRHYMHHIIGNALRLDVPFATVPHRRLLQIPHLQHRGLLAGGHPPGGHHPRRRHRRPAHRHPRPQEDHPHHRRAALDRLDHHRLRPQLGRPLRRPLRRRHLQRTVLLHRAHVPRRNRRTQNQRIGDIVVSGLRGGGRAVHQSAGVRIPHRHGGVHSELAASDPLPHVHLDAGEPLVPAAEEQARQGHQGVEPAAREERGRRRAGEDHQELGGEQRGGVRHLGFGARQDQQEGDFHRIRFEDGAAMLRRHRFDLLLQNNLPREREHPVLGRFGYNLLLLATAGVHIGYIPSGRLRQETFTSSIDYRKRPDVALDVRVPLLQGLHRRRDDRRQGHTFGVAVPQRDLLQHRHPHRAVADDGRGVFEEDQGQGAVHRYDLLQPAGDAVRQGVLRHQGGVRIVRAVPGVLGAGVREHILRGVRHTGDEGAEFGGDTGEPEGRQPVLGDHGE
ncbi:unnamed protein product [Phyllotreta striolata]|uniref:Uncharacterized protein n=1 Tax=Phyllotreta striolata TaxID=444603 RepID=A0A9N9TT73_PHYSR|nr:unnamed protein product [Phyllotreta striolata]